MNTKIMRDVNLIVEFLRKNKVRSEEINLPKKIIFNKNKAVVSSIWKEGTGDMENENKKDISLNDLERINRKFFSLL